MDHSRVWPATSHPDSAAARQIKGLVTRNQNLHWKVTRLTERLESKGLVLPRKTRNALDWVLMPDQRRNADEEKWDEAAKLWTALKDTSDGQDAKTRYCTVIRAASISILANSVTTGRDAKSAFKRHSQLRSLCSHASRS